MFRKDLLAKLFLCVLVLLVFLTGIAFGSWSPSFFEITLSDLIDVLLVVFMGSIVTYLVTHENAKGIKRLEYSISVVEQFETLLDQLWRECLEFIENPIPDNRTLITSGFGSLYVFYGSIKRLELSDALPSDATVCSNIAERLMDLKASVTNNDWGNNILYTREQVSEIHQMHWLLKGELLRYRANLLS